MQTLIWPQIFRHMLELSQIRYPPIFIPRTIIPSVDYFSMNNISEVNTLGNTSDDV